MSTNISGLNALVERLQRKIELLSDKIDSIAVTGGDNVLVNKIGNEFIINSITGEGGGGGIQAVVLPWHLQSRKVEDFDPENPKYIWSTNGGMVNNLLPDNYSDIHETGADDEGYIYWEAKSNYAGIIDLTCKFKAGLDDPPQTERMYEEEALPTSVQGLVGYVVGASVATQFAGRNIKVTPDIAYTINDEDSIGRKLNYLTWNFEEQ
jgi:hypothetical protein